jgi:hypothetical protein
VNAVEVIEHVKDLASWRDAPIDMRRMFIDELLTCSYGIGPTRQAWSCFYRGWMARHSCKP